MDCPGGGLENVHEVPFAHVLVTIKVSFATGASISFDSDWEIGAIGLWVGEDESAIHFGVVCEVGHDDLGWDSFFGVVSIQYDAFWITSRTKTVVTAWVSGTVFKVQEGSVKVRCRWIKVGSRRIS